MNSGYFKDATFYQFLGLETKRYSIVPRGTYKYPTQKDINLRVQKHFNVRKGKLSLMADILNVLNSDRPLYVWQDVGPDYNKVYALTPPRTFRIGLRFTY